MSTHDPSDWDELIDGLRDGDPQACQAFWLRYGALLERLAERQLSRRLQRRVGPEDVVQSACRTFFRRMVDGQFDLGSADDLWRLLCAITLTKARREARKHGRLKRGLDREQYLDSLAAEGRPDALAPRDRESSPFELAELSDQMDQLLRALSEEECRLLDLKLQQFTTDEIAQQLGCSERTVRRLTKKIQQRWIATIGEP